MGSIFNELSAFTTGRYNSGVAEQNADIADAAAKDAMQRGTIKAAQAQQRGTQVEGKQAAAYGASGVTSAGSPMDVMRDTSYFTDIDATTAMNNAAREAWGLRTKAAQFRQQASNDVEGAGISIAGDAISSGLGGGGGLLGGGGGGS